VNYWPQDVGRSLAYRLQKSGIPPASLDNDTPPYLLFDNAETTYWDQELWETFLKNQVQKNNRYRAILFCCFGSPSRQPNFYAPGTPPVLDVCSRISLRPRSSQHAGHGPIGLLFNESEFNDAIDRYRGSDRQPVPIDSELRATLFCWTAGHAGAIGDILEILSWQVRQSKNLLSLELKFYFHSASTAARATIRRIA
jgi:hypothetical protein